MPMGIFPDGTGNDMVKTWGISKHPMEALEVILSGHTTQVDTGLINDRRFLNVCGTGFDVTVLDYAQKAKRFVRGPLSYLVGVIMAIAHHAPVDLVIEENGEIRHKRALICSIANGRYIGGGIAICKDASVEDGLFDIVLLDDTPRWRLIGYLPGLLMGKVLSFDITHHHRCSSITLKSAGMKINVDGEIMTTDEARFTLLPKSLRIFANG